MSTNEPKIKNQPIAKFRVGSVTAGIWKNEGEKGTTFNATFDRRYRDNDNNWHSSASHNPDDLLALAKAADLAHTKILELQATPE